MSEQVSPTTPAKLEVVQVTPLTDGTIVNLITAAVPRLMKARDGATAALREITVVDDNNAQEVNELLIKVRETYDKMYAMRKNITDKTDQIKDYLIGFENAINTDSSKKNSEYNRVKALIATFEQDKINKNKEQQDKARLQAQKEQALTNFKASVKLNITDVIINLCKRIETGSQEFFSEAKTLEDFDKKASVYKSTKWKVKMEDYEKCFNITVDAIIKDEVGPFIVELKKELTYESVNALYLEKGLPLITIWTTKIPQLRETLAQMLTASDEDKVKLAKVNKDNQDAEALRSSNYLNEQQTNMTRSVEAEAAVENIEASFKEQASNQELEPTGPKKKVLRFKSDKPVAEICEVIYHVFMNKDFAGIYKLDKEKKPVLDDKGRPEYIDGVQFWLTQFQKLKIDAAIKGIDVHEDAKVIVRK